MQLHGAETQKHKYKYVLKYTNTNMQIHKSCMAQITNSWQHFNTSYISHLGQYGIFMHICTSLASLVLPKGRIDSIRPLGHIGFTCIYTSLGSFCRPIWPDICCKFHPLRGLYNRGRGIYTQIVFVCQQTIRMPGMLIGMLFQKSQHSPRSG